MSEIGDWYESKAREARELEEKLRLAREIACLCGRPTPKEIKHLEYLLELARYVGD